MGRARDDAEHALVHAHSHSRSRCSRALFGAFGTFYVVSAIALDAVLLGGVIQVLRKPVWNAPAWWLYKFSLLYLALLFAAMVIDRILSR